jgi:phytoene/squalene synthetase
MRVRDNLAAMFCKRVATKIKKAKAELEEIRLRQQELVEAMIGNYRVVLKDIDADGPAQLALRSRPSARSAPSTPSTVAPMVPRASMLSCVRGGGGSTASA